VLRLILENSSFAAKLVPNGMLVVQECHSNSLRVLDKQLSEVTKHEGIPDRVDISSINRQPHFSGEGSKIIWFGGKGSIIELSLKDMSYIVHADMAIDVSDSKPCVPICAIADFERNKLLAIYSYDNQNIVAFKENGRSPDHHVLEEIFPYIDKATAIDIFPNKVHCIIGGAGIDRDNLRSACVGLFKFSKALEVLGAIHLPGNACTEITCLKSSPSKEGIVFAGTDGPILVLATNVQEGLITIIKSINIPNLNCIWDITIVEDNLYAVADMLNKNSTALMQITFPTII